MSNINRYGQNRGGTNSVNLLPGYKDKSNTANSILMTKFETKKIDEKDKITLHPVEFFCTYHYLINDIISLMNAQEGNRLTEQNQRTSIEKDCYNLIAKYFEDKEIIPREDLLPKYINLFFADILGLGILEPLLNDPTIDEIMVKSHDSVYIEQNGKLKLSEYRFPSVDNAMGVVKKIITPLNLHIDKSCPNVNAQLPDGSRLSASIAPLRANGEISITIRKFKEEVEPLIYYSRKYQSSCQEMVDFLENAVKSRMSMLVSGGTGSGKTTLLNSLSMAIPSDERLLTCEDTLELKLQQPHVEAYQTIEANIEGKGAFTMRQIIIEALRKRPDRIIVGECRGGEIVEMFNAMNTGHEGSLSTVHANSPRDMVKRVLTMVLSNEATSNLNSIAIYQMMESSINLIVQTNRLQDGSRKITAISEIVGVGKEGYSKLVEKGIIKNHKDSEINNDQLYLQDIFCFRQSGIDEHGKVKGEFIATGYIPFCIEKMRNKGYGFSDDFFTKRTCMTVRQ